MPRRLSERTHIDIRKDRGDEITRIKGFLMFVLQTKFGEHLKVKIPQVKRKFAISERLSEEGEEKNN